MAFDWCHCGKTKCTKCNPGMAAVHVDSTEEVIASMRARLFLIREAAELCCEHLRRHDNGQALIDAIFDGSEP